MENSSSNSSSSYDSDIINLDSKITYYFTIVSSAIGIPGNLISLIIFIRLALKSPKINMGLLYSCQTAIDLTALIFILFAFRGSPYLYGYLVTNINDSFCRVFMFLRRYMLQASSWMSVLISFDRFIFVIYQNRFQFMKNKLILSAIILSVMILVAIADIENFFYYISGTSMTSLYTCIGSNAVTIASDIINMFLRTYIPMVLMVTFNSLMIYKIAKKDRSSQLGKKSSLKKKEHHFTIAVFSCSVLFFICNFPLAIFFVFTDVNLYSGAFKNNPGLSDTFSFYTNVFIDVSLIVQTCSIFMYMAFNKLFYKELITFIIEILPCKVFRNVSPHLSESLTIKESNV